MEPNAWRAFFIKPHPYRTRDGVHASLLPHQRWVQRYTLRTSKQARSNADRCLPHSKYTIFLFYPLTHWNHPIEEGKWVQKTSLFEEGQTLPWWVWIHGILTPRNNQVPRPHSLFFWGKIWHARFARIVTSMESEWGNNKYTSFDGEKTYWENRPMEKDQSQETNTEGGGRAFLLANLDLKFNEAALVHSTWKRIRYNPPPLLLPPPSLPPPSRPACESCPERAVQSFIFVNGILSPSVFSLEDELCFF